MDAPGGGVAVVLWLLAGLFLLRVLGQALVACCDVPWLPPMDAWQSGLLPYPLLLASQGAILALQTCINVDVTRGHGPFARRRPTLGRVLPRIAAVYAALMAGRYVVTVGLRPGAGWLDDAIPIAFHWVLAGYLFVLGRYHAGAAGSPR